MPHLQLTAFCLCGCQSEVAVRLFIASFPLRQNKTVLPVLRCQKYIHIYKWNKVVPNVLLYILRLEAMLSHTYIPYPYGRIQADFMKMPSVTQNVNVSVMCPLSGNRQVSLMLCGMISNFHVAVMQDLPGLKQRGSYLDQHWPLHTWKKNQETKWIKWKWVICFYLLLVLPQKTFKFQIKLQIQCFIYLFFNVLFV